MSKKKAKKKPAKKKKAKKKAKKKKAKKTLLLKAKKLTHDERLAQEQEVVSKLTRLDRDYDDRTQSSQRVRALIRAYRRKHCEAQDYREHLEFIRKFLKEAWDEEDEHFCAEYAQDPERFVPGHWCPNMIGELDVLLEPDTVWTGI